jgi:hypothetical protein
MDKVKVIEKIKAWGNARDSSLVLSVETKTDGQWVGEFNGTGNDSLSLANQIIFHSNGWEPSKKIRFDEIKKINRVSAAALTEYFTEVIIHFNVSFGRNVKVMGK